MSTIETVYRENYLPSQSKRHKGGMKGEQQ